MPILDITYWQVVTVKNATIGDASRYQYDATLPLQLQIISSAVVEVTQQEQPNMPNAITFAEAQTLDPDEYFSE